MVAAGKAVSEVAARELATMHPLSVLCGHMGFVELAPFARTLANALGHLLNGRIECSGASHKHLVSVWMKVAIDPARVGAWAVLRLDTWFYDCNGKSPAGLGTIYRGTSSGGSADAAVTFPGAPCPS